MRSLLLCTLLATVPLGAQEPDPPAPAPATQTLDKGHLDPAWFNLPASAFTPQTLADYGWIKPGFKFAGRSIKVVWEEPKWTDPGMAEDNIAAAETHRKNFPLYLKEALGTLEGVKTSFDSGDLLLVGRLVDCNIKGGFLSMAWEDITWDLKLVDPATGETLVALHNRLMGGNGWKGNGSRKRFLAWTESLAKFAKTHWLP